MRSTREIPTETLTENTNYQVHEFDRMIDGINIVRIILRIVVEVHVRVNVN